MLRGFLFGTNFHWDWKEKDFSTTRFRRLSIPPDKDYPYFKRFKYLKILGPAECYVVSFHPWPTQRKRFHNRGLHSQLFLKPYYFIAAEKLSNRQPETNSQTLVLPLDRHRAHIIKEIDDGDGP